MRKINSIEMLFNRLEGFNMNNEHIGKPCYYFIATNNYDHRNIMIDNYDDFIDNIKYTFSGEVYPEVNKIIDKNKLEQINFGNWEVSGKLKYDNDKEYNLVIRFIMKEGKLRKLHL